MKLIIDNNQVEVNWIDNQATQMLENISKKESITIKTHAYGGFEQVGDIGFVLPSEDKRITTMCGDIVLYDSHNIVLFHEANQWEYTRLGKIVGLDKNEIKSILNKKNCFISITK